MVTALVSLLCGRPVRKRVAMTGELTLAGIVLPVGGIKEKVLGAKRAGIVEVILPADNEPNVKEDLTAELLGDMKIHYVRTLDEVIEQALSTEKVAPLPLAARTEQAEKKVGPEGVRPIH
jgi:ATP-dependent Lon protease